MIHYFTYAFFNASRITYISTLIFAIIVLDIRGHTDQLMITLGEHLECSTWCTTLREY